MPAAASHDDLDTPTIAGPSIAGTSHTLITACPPDTLLGSIQHMSPSLFFSFHLVSSILPYTLHYIFFYLFLFLSPPFSYPHERAAGAGLGEPPQQPAHHAAGASLSRPICRPDVGPILALFMPYRGISRTYPIFTLIALPTPPCPLSRPSRQSAP